MFKCGLLSTALARGGVLSIVPEGTSLDKNNEISTTANAKKLKADTYRKVLIRPMLLFVYFQPRPLSSSLARQPKKLLCAIFEYF